MADTNSMKPGEFRETPEGEVGLHRQNASMEKPKIYFAESEIAMYKVFRDKVYNPQSVLYPSCGFDASPSKAFSKITFVDLEDGNQGCVRMLQELGLHAIKQDIRKYIPAEEHDLLILENPGTPTEWNVPYIRSGGYVLSNNYHLNASWLNAQKDKFSLVGIIDYDQNTSSARVTINEDGQLARTVSIDSIADSRPIEHLAFKTPHRAGKYSGLPFERVADKYIFQKK